MPPRLNLEERTTLNYLRRRVRDGMIEERGEITGRAIFKQRYGTLVRIFGDFQRFLDLSGRHFPDVAERIRELARSLGLGRVVVRIVTEEPAGRFP